MPSDAAAAWIPSTMEARPKNAAADIRHAAAAVRNPVNAMQAAAPSRITRRRKVPTNRITSTHENVRVPSNAAAARNFISTMEARPKNAAASIRHAAAEERKPVIAMQAAAPSRITCGEKRLSDKIPVLWRSLLFLSHDMR